MLKRFAIFCLWLACALGPVWGQRASTASYFLSSVQSSCPTATSVGISNVADKTTWTVQYSGGAYVNALADSCAGPVLRSYVIDYTAWYWIANDTSPTSQVYASATGSFVANSDATYKSWLAAEVQAIEATISAAANNGSGAVRLTVDSTSSLQTGQVLAVFDAAVSAYNATWTITVVDATHVDLQGSAFSSTTATGVLSGPNIVPTAGGAYFAVDSFNQILLENGWYNGVDNQGCTTGTTLTLSNNLRALTTLCVLNASAVAVLPTMSAATSLPVGFPISIRNVSNDQAGHTYPVVLKDANSNTLITIPYDAELQLTNINNNSVAGTLDYMIRYRPLAAGQWAAGSTSTGALSAVTASGDCSTASPSGSSLPFTCLGHIKAGTILDLFGGL